MSNKKIIFVGILFILISIVTCTICFSLAFNTNKLKGSVTDSNTELSMTCTKTTLEVNEDTTCSLIMNTGSYRAISFQGLLTSSSNISISNIQMGEGWVSENSSSPILVYYKADSFSPGEVPIATFNITAISEGTGYVKIGKQNDVLFMSYDDGDLGQIENFTEQKLNISVGSTPTPVLSNDASLKNLYVDEEDVLSTLSYEVDDSVDSVTINPVTNNKNASTTGGGETQLSVGNNTIDIVVTAEDGTTTNTYTLNIYRPPVQEIKEDFLTSLSITPGNLDDSFDPNVLVYTATVDSEVESVTVSATCGYQDSTLDGTGEHQLYIGVNYIDVSVISTDNVINTYTIVVVRGEADDSETSEKSSDASVRSILVDGHEVNLRTLRYNYRDLDTDSINIEVIPNDSKAKVRGNIGDQSVDLREEENKYNIIIIAEDGTINSLELIVGVNREEYEDDSDPYNPDEPSDRKECILTSEVYKIDNTNHIITNVDIGDTDETIKNNIKTSCGTISITNDIVTITNGTDVLTYKIQRIWIPKTGNDVIKYSIIFGIILGLVGITLVSKVLINKKDI